MTPRSRRRVAGHSSGLVTRFPSLSGESLGQQPQCWVGMRSQARGAQLCPPCPHHPAPPDGLRVKDRPDDSEAPPCFQSKQTWA